MLQTSNRQPVAAQPDMRFAEFIGLMALMIALTALSLDIMLPALGIIGDDLGLAADNDRQLIITFYMFGFAAGQLFFGPLSDRFGRKPPLYAGFAIYIVGTVLAAQAESATVMLFARVMQGIGSSAPRIVGIAIVRDKFAGRDMARVMSYVMMVFLVMPILAPSFGQVLLEIGSWRFLFIVLLFVCLICAVWLGLRLPETHASENRRPLSIGRIGNAIGIALTSRQTVGYTVSFGFMFGVLMSYVASAEQIFVETYDTGKNFPIYFAAIASSMILASIANTQLVATVGMRRLSHGALAATLATGIALGILGFPDLPLWGFCLYMALVFFCFGVIGPNFNAMAMEKVGQVAGTASSLIGFYSTGVGTFFGFLIGQSFDGTVRPLVIGITILALLAVITVLITERGRFAQPQHEPSAGRGKTD